jgi:hypothetical protein
MILDLFLFEHPQVQHASTSIKCLKELLNCQWLLLKTCVEIANMLCPTWALIPKIPGVFLTKLLSF